MVGASAVKLMRIRPSVKLECNTAIAEPAVLASWWLIGMPSRFVTPVTCGWLQPVGSATRTRFTPVSPEPTTGARFAVMACAIRPAATACGSTSAVAEAAASPLPSTSTRSGWVTSGPLTPADDLGTSESVEANVCGASPDAMSASRRRFRIVAVVSTWGENVVVSVTASESSCPVCVPAESASVQCTFVSAVPPPNRMEGVVMPVNADTEPAIATGTFERRRRSSWPVDGVVSGRLRVPGLPEAKAPPGCSGIHST